MLGRTDAKEPSKTGDSIPAPIALFVYKRPAHTRRAVEALKRNALASKSDLVVFSDAARDGSERHAVQEVREYLKRVDGFKSVHINERSTNAGLAESIISGVTQVCEAHGRVIVLEDDLVTAPSFLNFMNAGLNLYESSESVGSIHGYWYPLSIRLPQTFFLRGASCWGWATWSRAWSHFERNGVALLAELERRKLTGAFDLGGAMPYTSMLRNQIAGKVDSWAIRWHAAMFLLGMLQLSPSASLVKNIGFDGTGSHGVLSDVYDVEPASFDGALQQIAEEESPEALAALISYHRGARRSLVARILGRLRRMART
jgi:hypothetical protein